MASDGYTLAAFPWFIDQTVGGAVATGTHGSTMRFGSLSTQARCNIHIKDMNVSMYFHFICVRCSASTRFSRMMAICADNIHGRGACQRHHSHHNSGKKHAPLASTPGDSLPFSLQSSLSPAVAYTKVVCI